VDLNFKVILVLGVTTVTEGGATDTSETVIVMDALAVAP
jgi:hypothetical protein